MSEPRSHIDLFGATLLIGFSALLGLNQALVKIVNDGMAPLFQGGLRSVGAVLVVVIWVFMRGRNLSLPRETWLFGTLNGLLFSAEFAFLFLALDYSSVSRVSVLFYTMPFFVAGAAHFMFPDSRLNLYRSAGLVLAIGGVVLVMSDGFSDARASLLGDALALMAAICWAGIALLTRASRLGTLAPEQNLLYHLLISAVILTLLAIVDGDTFRVMSPTIWGIFGFQVVAVASLGFLMWLWVLSIYPVSQMASFSLLTPLFGVLFGWLIFDEQLTPRFVVALIAVCVGLLLINRRSH